MFENTKSSVRILGGATAVTLVLGLNAAAGVLPRLVSAGTTASVSQTALAPAIAYPVVDTATVPTEVVPTVVVAPTAPPATVKKPPVRKVPASAPVPTSGSTPAPAASTLASRTQPTSSQINQAIQGLRPYVFLFSPSPAQVVQAGDKVCTAFDEGKTFAEVKAMGLAAVAHIPLIGVSAGAADYVVRTGVALFCPAYQSKLA